MSTTRSGKIYNIDLAGQLVEPTTIIGTLRKIISLTIDKLFNGSVSELLESIDMLSEPNRKFLSHQKDKIKTNSWDDIEQQHPISDGRLKIEQAVINTFNSLPFPVYLDCLQDKLKDQKINLRPNQITKIIWENGHFSPRFTRQVVNATNKIKCDDRLDRAVEMQAELNAFDEIWTKDYKDANNDGGHRVYYYDQMNLNQSKLLSNIAFGPPNMPIYDPDRSTIKTESLTLHMIVNQFGTPIYWKITAGGTKQRDIEEFLEEAQDLSGLDPTKILYFDHLNSHVNIVAKKMAPIPPNGSKIKLKWNTRLTPLSCPDANLVEFMFRSVKAFVRKKLIHQRALLNKMGWMDWTKRVVGQWANSYKGNTDAWQSTRKFIAGIIKHKGNLQKIAFEKAGIKNLSQLKIQIPLTMVDTD